MGVAVNECPVCGVPGINMSVSGDLVQKFACVGGHRWELRPDADEAMNLYQQPEPKTGFKGFLQRLFS